MKPIVVATDFSPIAFNAALYAAEMAKSINGYIILLHVCPTPVTAAELPVIVDTATLVNDSEKLMAEHAAQLVHRTRERVMFETVVKGGGFFYELQLLCNSRKPYAVVMGCQGSSEAERLFFGSHVLHAMKQLAWPVIAVPPGARFSSIKKIGLATDFSNAAESTPVDELKVLVKDFHAELHVLNTGSAPSHDTDMVLQSHRLQQMLEPLNPSYDFIRHNDTDAGILEFADNNHIDLLIVLPRRHSLIEKLIFKSHTRQLVLHSHVPVMALHAQVSSISANVSGKG